MIIVNPIEGLANRMRVLNSCMILAKMNNKNKIYVIWLKSPEINLHFNEIFIELKNIVFIEKSFLFNLFNKKLNRKKDGYLKFYSNKCIKYLFFFYKYYDNKSVYINRFNKNLWSSNHSNVIMQTCFDFFSLEDGNQYYLFKLQPHLQIKVNDLIKKLTYKSYGLHIRRTDNVKSLEHSPIKYFIDLINYNVSIEKNILFYLSSDDKYVYSYLLDFFPNNILFQNRSSFDRNSKEGILEAAIDMYVLSNLPIIYGSYWSSFSEVSSWIKSSQLIIVKEELIDNFKINN